MFIADAPTTTTQRLRALATGGPPTFFDISSSFSAAAVAEDNLLAQLRGAGRKLVRLRRLCLLGVVGWGWVGAGWDQPVADQLLRMTRCRLVRSPEAVGILPLGGG